MLSQSLGQLGDADKLEILGLRGWDGLSALQTLPVPPRKFSE